MKLIKSDWKKLVKSKFKKNVKKAHIAFHLRNLLLAIFILTALFQIQVLVYLSQTYAVVINEKEDRMSNFKYWKSVAGQFPYIPDILYNAAIASISVGKASEAVEFLDKALRIDPLFEKALSLREEFDDS